MTMTLTDRITRLLAAVALGTAAFVPALALTPGTAAAQGDNLVPPTTNPCQSPDNLIPCPPPPPPPCPDGQVPIPIPGPHGIKVKCVPCENLPAGAPGSCHDTPECDPEVEECEDTPECDPEVEKCDDTPPGDDPGDDPRPDRPVPGRPTFTG